MRGVVPVTALAWRLLSTSLLIYPDGMAAGLAHEYVDRQGEALATVIWKREQFRIAGHPVSEEMFDQWVTGEGRSALREALRSTRMRWLFGSSRARRHLHRTVRSAFRPGGTFCAATVKQLNQLPAVVRACAIGIQRTGHRQLVTYHASAAIVVVPRGVVRNDIKVKLIRELATLPQVREFNGLTERVLSWAATGAECALFDHIARNRQLVDESGRGVILGGDGDFRWNLNGVQGHYYYGASLEERVDLTNNKERRRFLGGIRDLYQGQTVHLKRMRPDEARETAEAFRLLQKMDLRASETPAERARRIREMTTGAPA